MCSIIRTLFSSKIGYHVYDLENACQTSNQRKEQSDVCVGSRQQLRSHEDGTTT